MNETPKEPLPPPDGAKAPTKRGLSALFARVSAAISAKLKGKGGALGRLPELVRKRPVQIGLAVAALLALLTIAATIVVLYFIEPEPSPVVTENVPDANESADSGPVAPLELDAAPPPETPKEPPPPPPWRVTDLRADPAYDVKELTIGRRTVNAVLLSTGLSKAETHRVIVAFEPVHRLDRSNPKDQLIVAKERRTGRLYACEYLQSPKAVWQAREAEGDSHSLAVKKLEFLLTKEQKGYAVVVGADLRQSFSAQGLGEAILSRLDDALDGHAELSDLHSGTVLRILLSDDRIVGGGVLATEVDAVEYTAPSAKALRVYLFDSDEPGARKVKGFYDAKGRRPMHGGFRKPVPFARIASRFNPNRMHPVLHVVMPHNGVDFAASTGTPVYATAQGVVKHVGDGGPCGNMVQIEHANDLVSAYCHLSRFAAGLHVGQHVDAVQLIGYVGATGRVTGPHLHFAMKRRGVFIDPLRMSLDGERVLPRTFREEFSGMRAKLDTALDGIALGKPEPVVVSPPEPVSDAEVFFEDMTGELEEPKEGGAPDADPFDAAPDASPVPTSPTESPPN